MAFSSQATSAEAYVRNNRHYVNSSGHVVHSPSCGSEPIHSEAIYCDGSVSFSEYRGRTCTRHHRVERRE